MHCYKLHIGVSNPNRWNTGGGGHGGDEWWHDWWDRCLGLGLGLGLVK